MRVLVLLAVTLFSSPISLSSTQGQEPGFLLPDRNEFSNGRVSDVSYFKPSESRPQIVARPLKRTSFNVAAEEKQVRPEYLKSNAAESALRKLETANIDLNPLTVALTGMERADGSSRIKHQLPANPKMMAAHDPAPHPPIVASVELEPMPSFVSEPLPFANSASDEIDVPVPIPTPQYVQSANQFMPAPHPPVVPSAELVSKPSFVSEPLPFANSATEEINIPVPMPTPQYVQSADQFMPAPRVAEAPVLTPQEWETPVLEDQFYFPKKRLVFDTSNCCDEWKDFCACKKMSYVCPCNGVNSNQCGCGGKSNRHQKRRCNNKTGCHCGNPRCAARRSARKTDVCKGNTCRTDGSYEPNERGARFSLFTLNVNNYGN